MVEVTNMHKTMAEQEVALRKKLGIPADAAKVLILGESSHWDPQWLCTTEVYYQLRIKTILNGVLRELRKDPRRAFAIESICFLKMFWEGNPSKQNEFRTLINSGRVLLTGTGLTEPDTNIPQVESIIRDYQIGQQWLRENGITQEVDIAAQHDNFGHNPVLPSILNALGFHFTAFWRLDGSYCEGNDIRSESEYPLPGSTAETLLKLRTVDFFWKSHDGSELRCLHMPYSYGMADDLTVNSALLMPGALPPRRWSGLIFGIPSSSERRIAGRIKEYADKLAAISKTDYLFCPMGNDFNDPLPGLMKLIDRYNKNSYPDTGIYVVDATVKDYFDLTAGYRDRFPTLENVDINPFCMGHLSVRPEIKQRSKKLIDDLVMADNIVLNYSGEQKQAARLDENLKQAWEVAAISNHHDFISGTSAWWVVRSEQIPMLKRAQKLVDAVLAEAGKGVTSVAKESAMNNLPHWNMQDNILTVENAHYSITLDKSKGGCITAWVDKSTGKPVLDGPGNDLVLYEDSGGLWRMPQEFLGGVFKEIDRSSRHLCSLDTRETDGLLQVSITTDFEGIPVIRTMKFRENTGVIDMAISGKTRKCRTVTCCFPLGKSGELAMDVPGCIVVRPGFKIFRPTYWTAGSFVYTNYEEGPGIVLAIGQPLALGMNNNDLNFIAIRNVDREKAYFKKSLWAFPVGGEVSLQSVRYTVSTTMGGDWYKSGVRETLRRVKQLWRSAEENRIHDLAERVFSTDNADVSVIGAKKAEHGTGYIIHLLADRLPTLDVTLKMSGKSVQRAWICDARERDIAEIVVEDGAAIIPVNKIVFCIRIATGK